MNLRPLVDFYQSLEPASVSRVAEFYAADAWFKDPFNEVRGVAAIEKIFARMFEQVEAPRFVISETLVCSTGVMLVWEFYFHLRQWRPRQERCLRGVSHLRFDEAGKIFYHRDYWDTGEELYMKLPAIGLLYRGLRRLLAA